MMCSWCGKETDVGTLCLTCLSDTVYGTEKYRETKERVEKENDDRDS
jgi:hypothetical protein